MTPASQKLAQALGVAAIATAVACWQSPYVSVTTPLAAQVLALIGAGLLWVGVPAGRRIACLVVAGLVAMTSDLILARYEIQLSTQVDMFARVVAPLLRLQYEQVSVVDGILEVFHRDQLTQVTPHTSLLGFRDLTVVFVTSLVVLACQHGRRTLSILPWSLLGLLGIMALRFAWVTVRHVHSPLADLDPNHLDVARFWSFPVLVVSAIAVASMLQALTPPVETPAGERRSKRKALIASTALAGVVLGVALGFTNSGTPKAGRVMIDDRLSGIWEPASRLLTQDRYGDFSTYSFAAMTEYLARRFEVTVNTDRQYTPALLAKQDVLVLKTPHDPLEPSEVAAIQEWTESGGGLFLIGDHTDLSGMNTNLNAIAARWGAGFQNDSVEVSDRSGFVMWEDPYWSTHPITAGLPPFGFMTGCSVTGSLTATPAQSLERVVALEGDYSKNSNFGTVPPRPASPQGVLAGTIALEAGSGRVALFSDSTVFSTFAFYVDGHAQFVGRTVAWLNRSSSPLDWLWPAGAASSLLCMLLIVRRARPDLTSGSMALAVGLCGFLLAVGPASKASGKALGTPQPWTEVPRIGVVTEGGQAVLPPVLGTQPEGVENFNFMTLIQVPMRFGMEVEVISRAPQALEGLDAVLVLNPDAEHDETGPEPLWLEALDDFVMEGGTLIVMSSAEHAGHEHILDGAYLEPYAMTPLDLGTSAVDSSSCAHGSGKVVHIIGSEEFALEGLGHCMSLPSQEQRTRYELLYDLFERMGLGSSLAARQIYWPTVPEPPGYSSQRSSK